MPLNLLSLVTTSGTAILDTLFPIRCISCNTFGAYLCTHCLALLPRRLQQRCPTCLKATTPRGEVCFSCTGKRSLDGLFAASHYRHPLVATAIHTYKYRFIPALSEPLGQWLGGRLADIELALPDLYIPVPLHPRRLRFRGFNQSALLTHILSDTLTPGSVIPVVKNFLLRTRSTKSQIKTVSRDERLHNLYNAFTIAKKSDISIRGKTLWLIDDVATTGTTLEECARVLKKAGAKSVFGIVLAR
ncbi:MAG TPA: ComF family protein [Patescibacteria group bacterium]|nr:ComF family protein [Patescibacteria group bacterium]